MKRDLHICISILNELKGQLAGGGVCEAQKSEIGSVGRLSGEVRGTTVGAHTGEGGNGGTDGLKCEAGSNYVEIVGVESEALKEDLSALQSELYLPVMVDDPGVLRMAPLGDCTYCDEEWLRQGQ